MITVFSEPTTEPLTIAEVMAHCRVDASNQELPPDAVTVALASTPIAGNVDNGAHRYLATFVTADGETQSGVVSASVTVADKTTNGQVSVTGIPLGGASVTARKLYRTAAGGSTYMLLATISNNTATTYTDNIADSSLGAGAPTTNTTSDPVLTMMIKAARQHAEVELHRYLITQTIDAYFEDFPRYANSQMSDRAIYLPPLQSVSAITYVDTDGATQTLAADQYAVDIVSRPSRITAAYGVSWPSVRVQANAVKVRAIAGYGAASAVPASIKHWMLMRIGTMYEKRDQFVEGLRFAELPQQWVDSLLDAERVTGRVT